MRIRNQEDKQIVNEISENIKKIQKSSGEEKKALILKAKKKFQIEINEKWVITKLRLLLVSYKADLKFFQINPPEIGITIDEERKHSVVNGEPSPKRKFKCYNKDRHISKNVNGRIVKPRLTPTEKQLYKLRNTTFNESDKEKLNLFRHSKLEYLKYIGLHAKVISLS